MAKDVKFNIKLNIDGKEHIVQASTDIQKFSEEIRNSRSEAEKLRDDLIRFNQIGDAFKNAASGIQKLTGLLSKYADANAMQVEAETKLANNMRNTMNAREEDIQSIKNLCSEQQKLGVIGDEVQLAGAQELATYLSEKSSLEKLIPVMNDMVAQQYGLNATQESATTIATMLGKVMEGQTSALSRYGYFFTDAQERILKFGDEEQRAATLADVITASVGGTNAALAQTDAGKMKQVANETGDTREKIGELVQSFGPLIERANLFCEAMSGLSTAAVGIAGISYTIRSLKEAIAGLSITTAISTSITKLSAAATKFWANQVQFANRMQIAWTFGAKKFVIQAVAVRAAMLGITAITGVGLAIAAVTSIMALFSSSASAATKQAKLLTDASGELSESGKAGAEAYGEVKSALATNIAKLEDFKGSKKEEAKLVAEMNDIYGRSMGYFSSVADWYAALTKNSEAYCRQMVIEARTREITSKIANLETENRGILYDEKGNRQKYSAKRNQRAVAGATKTSSPAAWATPGAMASNQVFEDIVGSSAIEQAQKKYDDNKAKIESLTQEFKELSVEAAKIDFAVKGSKTNPTTASSGSAAKSANTAEPKVEDVMPAELKTLDDYSKKLEILRKQRNSAEEDAIIGIDNEIAATEKAKKALENKRIAAIKDEEINDSDTLNQKLSYYNQLLGSGDMQQKIMAQNGINYLNKLSESWESVITEATLPKSFSSINDFDKAINFYSSRQQGEDADQILKTQKIIDDLTAKKRVFQLSTEIPDMQKEVDEINALTGHDHTVKIKGMGFEEITKKIREMDALLSDTKNPVTDEQRKSIEKIKKSYAEWAKQSAVSFSTLRSGYSDVKNIGSGVQGITDALEGDGNAWEKVTGVIDGFLQIYDGISQVIEIINMITEATQALTTAKGAEAAMTEASTAADIEGASASVTASASKTAAAQSETNANIGAAASGFMKAHAALPFVGFAIAAGMVAAMIAMMAKLPKFAKGGIAYGPTLGLFGEYGGASNNPEVVAPLDKLRSLIEPQGMTGGKVEFELDGYKLRGVLKRVEKRTGRS